MFAIGWLVLLLHSDDELYRLLPLKNNAFWHLHRDTVTRGRSSLSAHHLAFSVALLAQAHQ